MLDLLCPKQYAEFEAYLESKGFSLIGSGLFRRTFVRKKIVVKIPRRMDGLLDNQSEALTWHKYRERQTSSGIYVAPCRLLSNGCLMMVKVDSSQRFAEEWTRLLDGRQAGKYKDRIVAYDFGLDVDERAQLEKNWGLNQTYYQEVWLRHKPQFLPIWEAAKD